MVLYFKHKNEEKHIKIINGNEDFSKKSIVVDSSGNVYLCFANEELFVIINDEGKVQEKIDVRQFFDFSNETIGKFIVREYDSDHYLFVFQDWTKPFFLINKHTLEKEHDNKYKRISIDDDIHDVVINPLNKEIFIIFLNNVFKIDHNFNLKQKFNRINYKYKMKFDCGGNILFKDYILSKDGTLNSVDPELNSDRRDLAFVEKNTDIQYDGTVLSIGEILAFTNGKT